jgi:hypothetical protein
VSQQKFLDLFDVVEEEEMKESRSEFEWFRAEINKAFGVDFFYIF